MVRKPNDISYPVLVSLLAEIIRKVEHEDEYEDKIYGNKLSREKRLEKALEAIFGKMFVKSKRGRKEFDETEFIIELYNEFKATQNSRLSIIKRNMHKAKRLNDDVDEQNIIDRLDDKLKKHIQAIEGSIEMFGKDLIESSNQNFDEYIEEEKFSEILIIKDWLKANEKHVLSVLGYEGLIKQKKTN